MTTIICRLGGLTAIVVLVAVLPGEQRALLLFGALTTAWQPLQTVVAGRQPEATTFTHPLARTVLRTLALAAGSVALVIGMQAVVGHVDLFALVSTAPRHGTRLMLPNVPQLVPIAALEFVTFLQLDMTCEGRPFTRLPSRWRGWAALAAATVITVAGYRLLVNWDAVPSATRAAMGLADPHGPIPAGDLPVWLILVAAWQVISRNLLDGWPGTVLPGPAGRIAVNNLVVLAGGTLTYLALTAAGLTPATIAALGGCAVAGGRLVTDFLPRDRLPGQGRPGTGTLRAHSLRVASAAACTAGLYLVLLAAATLGTFSHQPAGLWIAVVALNLISGGITWQTGIIARGRRPGTVDQPAASESEPVLK
ncbi:MAG TPA: hypothetical protein VGD91_13710 [Trebonia sp.]